MNPPPLQVELTAPVVVLKELRDEGLVDELPAVAVRGSTPAEAVGIEVVPPHPEAFATVLLKLPMDEHAWATLRSAIRKWYTPLGMQPGRLLSPRIDLEERINLGRDGWPGEEIPPGVPEGDREYAVAQSLYKMSSWLKELLADLRK